jgi:hypothetical protein
MSAPKARDSDTRNSGEVFSESGLQGWNPEAAEATSRDHESERSNKFTFKLIPEPPFLSNTTTTLHTRPPSQQ